MNLLNFTTQFPDEASCKAKWKEYREQEGVVCPHCGSKEYYWKSDKEVYECKHYKYRQSLQSNTVMHGSQLLFRMKNINKYECPYNRLKSIIIAASKIKIV
jgi:uncharacterized Zn finger protein (UPF0148 family)